MESTGVYWKPVWNVLEGRFELLLANARRVKTVPGVVDVSTDREQGGFQLNVAIDRPAAARFAD